MGFKESLDSLRAKVQAKVKPDSTKEELEEIKSLNDELDALEKGYNEKVTENAKFRDTIVDMVTSQGDGKTPPDPSGRKPRSMEQFLEDYKKEKGE